MNNIDTNALLDDSHDEESMILNEVIKDDVDLCYIHHYLSEIFSNKDL